MITTLKTKAPFKAMALAIAFSFLWQQILWAGDLAATTLENLNQEQSQTFAPDYLQNQQTASQSMITQKQDVEDTINSQAQTANNISGNTKESSDNSIELQGPKSASSGQAGATSSSTIIEEAANAPEGDGAILSVTTGDGDIVHYADGAISSIEKKDGTVLRDLVIGENNELIAANITYKDDTNEIVANGKVARLTKPDGTVFEYSGELITRATYPDPDNPEGNVVDYFYSVDNDNNIIETKLKDSEKSSFYDKNGALIRVEFNTGKVIEYDSDKNDDTDNGILSKVITEDGKIYIYEKSEDAIDGETVYTVKLKEIRDGEGNTFRLEDNNITEIELSDGTILRNFELDSSGNLVSGNIIYKDNPTLRSILVENKRVKEVNDVNGVRTTYRYDRINEAGDIVNATIEIDDGSSAVETYTYTKDEETLGVTITNGDRTWKYNSAWVLESFSDSEGAIKHHYSPLAVYAGSTFTLSDGTIKEYNDNKSLIKTILTDGTAYEYYQSGKFAGKLQKEVSPDGKSIIYDYKITPEGDLVVYKRTSYDKSSSYKSYYATDNVNYTTNPTLKASFNLDSDKTYSSAYASASYYNYNDKSVSLSLSFYNEKPYLYYYSYNYKTKQYVYDYKQLDITINKDTDYTVEYIWTSTGVNIYLYKSSGTRPGTALYTIADNKWNPVFSLSGSNAHLTLDPSSSGTYTGSESVSTDYNNPLKGGPMYAAEFTFDQNAASRSLYYSVYGNNSASYDSIYFNYYNNTPSLSVYHYDYKTYQYTNKTIPVNVAFNKGATYVMQTKMEDNVLKLYIYEKGTAPGDPIYTIENAVWNPQVYSTISGGRMNVEAYDNLEVYKYGDADGTLLERNSYADKALLTYIYDDAREVIGKKLALEDGTKKIYDAYNKLLTETKANGEIAAYEYDASGNVISITPRFPDGTGYTYYDSGAFQGKLKSAAIPDGKVVYYDYAVNENGNLQVYKRVSYDKSNLYQSIYSNNYIPASINPAIKASFKLDSLKTYSSIYMSAYYYNYNDKSVSLSLNIYGQKPTLYYYYYDYKTRKTVSDNKELNITVNRNVVYSIEFAWSQNGINIYLYEASEGRPSDPVYTIANSNWNPRFSLSGSNANIIFDPTSSGTYTNSKSVSTDYNNPLKNSPIHTATFTFDSNAAYKSLYYGVYGYSSSSSDSLYLNYYNNTLTLWAYHYDYKTYKYTNTTIPLNIKIKDNTAYTLKTKIENNTLKFYIYEALTAPADPVYTIENVSWDPQVYASISGGDMNVEACDHLETYEYNTTAGIMLDQDAEARLRNKNIVIDDPYSAIPEYALLSDAPMVFPNGRTDIINAVNPNMDFSISLPAGDPDNNPYFDTIKYDQNRVLKEILKPSGEKISYRDGLVDNILSSSSTTSYGYRLSGLGNVDEITVDRDGIKRIYDKYGNIKSLSLDDATKIVYENGKVKEIQKADGTTLKNMTFRDSGELDSALVSYPDGSLALYDDAKLLQAISASGDITDYSDGKIRKVTLEDGTVYDWSYSGDNIVILDNAKSEKRTYLEGKLISLEELAGSKLITRYYYDGTSGDLTKSEICRNNEILYTYTYTYEDGLTLVRDEDGNVQAYTKDKKLSYIIDSKGRKYSYTYVGKNEGYVEVYFPSGNKAKYDLSGNIIEITKSDGTVIKDITFYSDNTPRNFTYIKDGATYKVEEGKIGEMLSKDGVKTVYYDNGFVKSFETEAGDLTEYQYFVKDSKVFNSSSALLDGDFNQVSLFNSNSTTYLTLSQDSLRFGTGTDGVKHVTANETLEAGTYNFESLMIDAGKTLTIASGAIIKVLGTITVNGAIFCGGSLDIYAPSFNVGASGSVTGAVNIKCNTINNAGIITGNASITGTLSNGANELDRDDSFSGWAHYLDYNPGSGALSPRITFPSCTISSVKWQAGGGGSGDSQGYGILYLYIDGVKTQVSPTYYWGRCPGSFNTGVATINGSWNNVTGIEYYIETDSTIGVARAYGYEMQAFIGTPTIEYISGSPGTVNTTQSRPIASIKQSDHPSSSSFESGVIELNALDLGSISWSQELPEGTNITFQTRTGDTATPDSTWSEWSTKLTSPASSQITSPTGKYIQYRINLSTTNPAVTPLLKLGENSPITFGYSRAPSGSSELPGIYCATMSKGGVTSDCDKNSLASLIFNPDYMGAITDEIPDYLLNGTQKELYLKDSVIISELTAITNIDGTTTEYCQGQISKTTRSDGTIIKSVSFDADNNAKDFTYSKDGSTYIVKDGKIDTVVTASGESVKYYSYGLIESTEAAGSKKEYEYGIQTTENYTTRSIFQDGSFTSASILGHGSTTYLQLSKDSLRFGTGSDGVKHVTANETLEAGTYNFESLIIDPGTTLIVGPNTIIKVLDTVTVNGAVFCGGSLDICTPVFNVSSSGSVTGSVNIKCDAISSAGIITGNVCLTGAGGSGATTDDNFGTCISGSHGAGGSAAVTFPSCNISKARYRASLGSYGLPAYANVYLCVNGSWTCIASYAGAGDSGEVNNTTGWSNVTGMMMTGQSLNGDCVCSVYNLYEMQAIIGQSTIEYTSGNPGIVNTTPSRPTVNIKAYDYPSSGSFESGVIELNALDLGSISWNQELPEGTNIAFQTRTGDTAIPDSTWSEWSESLTDSKGSDILSPGKKYFQYKINLSTADPSVTPKVLLYSTHGISISYIKVSDNPLDPYVKVKENNTTSAYNKSGVLIWTEDAAGVRTDYDPANSEGTVDLALLKFDSSYTDSLTQDLPSSKLSDSQKVITVYDQGNDTPVEVITAGQSITYFDEGFATKVVDKNGVTQVTYTYDEDKNIIKVEFVDARQKLEENYEKALTEIVTQKDAALAKLVKADAAARADILAKSADIQKQIDSERSRLIQEKAKYDSGVYDLSEFDRAFREIDDYETRLHQQTQDAYTDLDNQIASAKARIEFDASTAMWDLIDNDYNKILGDIVQKESSPLIYQYYRKILGRDPGDEDLLYWANIAKTELRPLTASEITQYLKDLPEYADREARKQNIITSLTDFFAQYLSASDADKESILSSLGLTLDDVATSLRGAEGTEAISGIISWLSGQSLHFGDSAFETIIAMLKDNGIEKSFEDIGKDALKVDILTGVITKDTEGDLLISMYAMRKAAEANGLTLSSQKISYDDLKDQVSRNSVIVHIDGKHYVLVTSINDADGTITYIDLTVGHNGQAMTLSRAEFMEKWRGYSLSKELSYNKDLPSNPSKEINVTQEKNIRGSGWWSDFWRGIVNFFQRIIAPIGAILLFTPLASVGAILIGINVVVQTISFVVHTGTLMDVVWSVVNAVGSAICSTVLPNIFDAVRGAFQSIGSAFSSAFSSIGQAIPILGKVFGAPMEIFQSLSGAATDIATRIWSTTGFTETVKDVVLSIGTRIIEQGVSLGANYLFKSMGLDPTLASIGSALISGAIAGLGNPNIGIVGGILQSGVISGVDQLGTALKLDPNITSLAGMMAGSIIGGSVYTGTGEISYQDLIKSISPYIYSECAYIGVTDVGELLGIDSRISYLAGVGIRSSINIGYGSDGIFDWKDAWSGVQQGLLQGITSIGINYATQELGLNPLLANIGFSAISGAINAGIQAATGDSKDIFQSLFKTYTDNALTFLGYGDPSNAWQQAAYIAQIQDFTKIVTEKGFVEALNTYGASFFNSVAVNSIVQSGMSIGQYFAKALGENRFYSETINGKTYKTVEIRDKNGNLIGSSGMFETIKLPSGEEVSELVGKRETTTDGSFLGIGNLGVDVYGKVGFTDAELATTYDGIRRESQTIDNGLQVYADVCDLHSGDVLLTITPKDVGGWNIYSEDGEYVDANIKEFSIGYDISIKNSETVRYLSTTMNWLTEEQRDILKRIGYSDAEIDKISLEIGLVIDDSGKTMLQYSIGSDIQKLINVSGALGNEWLNSLKLDVNIFNHVSNELLDVTSYTKNTRTLIDTEKGISAVDMLNLEVFKPEEYLKYAFTIEGFFQKIGYENSVWEMSVNDAAIEVGSVINSGLARFVYVPGINTAVNDLSMVQKISDMLGMDSVNKTVVIAHSAGVDAAVRSMKYAKADKYVFISPRSEAYAIYKIATENGIDLRNIMIINSEGDIPNWSGNQNYWEQCPNGYKYTWENVYIKNDVSKEVNLYDFNARHSWAINYWVDGATADGDYFNIYKDGVMQDEPSTMTKVIKEFIKK
ncbi:MAG: cysteine peptidase family C39 domain-containing protein [Candidatus Omnitrophica bacterium]|nr:cysteine peptidase family C39 domain-containing protein [Candidatus Omnitrophota bacterium]